MSATRQAKAPDRPRGPDDPPPTADDIARWLGMFIDPGQDVELRALNVLKPFDDRIRKAVSSFYRSDQLGEMARQALRLSGHADGVYFTINPVRLPLIPRKGKKGARDEDIARRRLLLIDCDPRRPADTSATDGEKATALATTATVREFLEARGWPAPVAADSGNGGHLLYAIDLPNDGPSRDLIRAVLKALAARFDSAAVAIDTAVFNASRVAKLYGTMARKGTATADRPHRLSRVLTVPKAFTPVAPEQLQALAATTSTGTTIEVSAPAPTGKRRRRPTADEGTTISPDDRLARARRYAATCDPAISGQGGHNQTFKVASNVGVGFDLTLDETVAVLRDDYNPKCEPPWSESELRHKVEDAFRRETRPRGFLLDVPPSRPNGKPHHGPARGGSNGDGPPGDGHSGGGPGDRRPVITITTEEHRVNDQAVAALAADPNVFQRANMLMTVIREVAPRNRVIIRTAGSPRITPLPLPRLREILTRRARWEKVRKTKDGDDVGEPAHPPDWAVNAVAARGTWPEIRPLEALIETPALRPDGTILDRPGYDERTGLLYEPNAAFPTIPKEPTRDDARRAAAVLSGLVVDFPFAGDDHRAAYLAALLTPLARFAIAGPCPLFLIDANTPATGKSKLTDIVATIATGRSMPRTTYPDTDDEMRKRISSIALAGDRLMLLDNIAHTFGGSALDSALTALTWRDRILGRSEMTPELPLFTVWYATGNNVALRGDALRRIIPCRLESREERPEERSDFTIAGDLLEYVRDERPRLVTAALTLLRAHAAAGCPSGGVAPLGSFEAWSRVVRSAVHWATGIDPCRTREELRAADPDTIARAALVEGWASLPDGAARGVTAAEALKLVKEDAAGRYDGLKEALMSFSRNDDLPTVKALGMRLTAMRNRVINGTVLRSDPDPHDHKMRWRVESKGQVGA